MPRRFFTKRRLLPVVTSIKNRVLSSGGSSGTTASIVLAKAVTTPSPTSNSDVSHGCIIKAIYLSVDGCGLGGSGVLNNMYMYLIKNPGNNLTVPAAVSWGTSNEKKFIIRAFSFMIMRNQEGNNPFHFEGWIRIPKLYQRMGTDDTWLFVHEVTTSLTGHIKVEAIYKWYR